jgi:ATP adenylyltransferase
MNKLWAPWRAKYITGKKDKGCIFCRAAKSKSKVKSYLIFKTKHSILMLNIFPYNNGHVMVSPIRHIRDFSFLRQEEVLDLFAALNKAKKLLDKVLKPHGYNIGINISKAAGAGIAGHMHIHIVPRWIGDTNFMPVLNDAKIISQSLDELYKRLKHAGSKTN